MKPLAKVAPFCNEALGPGVHNVVLLHPACQRSPSFQWVGRGIATGSCALGAVCHKDTLTQLDQQSITERSVFLHLMLSSPS
jgi:hypothetical protein